ncbi:MAG: RsmD family RNA methyltransferase [Megasphaera micronuciformis]|nr:RsmD family RNA methyltransferase [Megasphaera micronuciformis]
MTIKLNENERLDDLILDGMKLIQRNDEFCFSLDTVLLARFGDVIKGPTLDLGTGTAAIPLILSARGATEITALELNPVMADIAARNVVLNGKESCVVVRRGDYRRIEELFPAGSFSVVYANPPYRELFRGSSSDKDGVRKARHEETATLRDVLRAVAYALKFHGRFRMVHTAQRLAEILAAMREVAIEPKVLRPVYGRIDKDAKCFLVEGIRGGNPGMVLQGPLVVHEADGAYTQEVLHFYGKD